MTIANKEQTKHASCVAIDGNGVMLTGPSGCGKSDLALRLVDRGATLISDDYINLSRDDGEIMLNAPVNIAGKIEVRSLGIFEIDNISNIPLKLHVRLQDDVDRYPMEQQSVEIFGRAVTTISLNAHSAIAPILVEMALKRLLETEIEHE